MCLFVDAFFDISRRTNKSLRTPILSPMAQSRNRSGCMAYMSWKNNCATEPPRYLITIHFLKNPIVARNRFFPMQGAASILAAPENQPQAMAWRTDSIASHLGPHSCLRCDRHFHRKTLLLVSEAMKLYDSSLIFLVFIGRALF